MRRSSKASACRRELNSHNAAVPRALGQSQLRASHGPQRAAAFLWCMSPLIAVAGPAPRQCPLGAALPNPSFKPSSNGVPRGPGWRYAVHFRHPGPRVTPLAPA